MTFSDSPFWKTLNRFVEMRSPWLTLIGEHLEDHRGKRLDYWRIEKADSAVIVTIQQDFFIFPKPLYRPGVGEVTLDFPGGRIPPDTPRETVVRQILQRELGIERTQCDRIIPLNPQGWSVNSSFSNQKLYGFVVELAPNFNLNSDFIGATYPVDTQGICQLLQDLTCLQCRAVLLELINNYQSLCGL
ncbi:hypothetical protein [Spirulina subsalsa]|uniref:hypothetical protein n=1 Tax=Spirulina subsalsa TaxID=54311 RepID=UPI00031EA470|nr:hypothetical protein [Spirulina subsalsa]